MLELELVKAFHEKYKIPILNNSDEVKMERIELRINLLTEELKELEEADKADNIEEIAKEAGDVVYVLLGTALELGYYKAFEFKTLFATAVSTKNKTESLQYLTNARDLFKNDWSTENLAFLLRGVGDYLHFMGLKKGFKSIMLEVHRSNMSKGTDGKPIIREDGKIMKGTDFSPADLSFVAASSFAERKYSE
jgi:predicted HAD superfamily Cof-like phosphohydrolase